MITTMLSRKSFYLAACSIFLSPTVFSETLENAIQFAVNGHPEVKASINSRLSADSDLRGARGRYLPSINLNAGTGRQEVNSPTASSVGLNRQESGISLSQTLFDGFATSSEVGRQQATVNSRASKVMSTSEATALSGVTAYLDVLQREEFVRLAQENLTSHERIYDQIKLRSDQGVGRLADLDQAEARLAQARNNLLTEQTNP
ncbi:MAG: Outer membrane efflux protein BepC [Candidatus Erwinia impunctatus]|nr:Outer membrane efflux protein BepC [Culicoides impunctatus]